MIGYHVRFDPRSDQPINLNKIKKKKKQGDNEW
jgi:hypothetical protein